MIMDEVIKERKDGFKAECNFRTKEKSYFLFNEDVIYKLPITVLKWFLWKEV